MQVYFIRHTKPAISSAICYGHTDLDLADSFKEEAEIILKQVPENLDVVFSSPLLRCKSLADRFGCRQIIDDRLIELNFGNWEMLAWDDIPKVQLNAWMADFVNIKPEGGESFLALYHRVANFIGALRKEGHQKVAVVTHAGVIRAVYAFILQMPLSNAFKVEVPYGSIHLMSLGESATFDMIHH